MNDITSIKSDEMYLVSEIAEQLGIGKRALRQARQDGLKVIYWANRSYVMGKDMIAHITQHGRDVR